MSKQSTSTGVGVEKALLRSQLFSGAAGPIRGAGACAWRAEVAVLQ